MDLGSAAAGSSGAARASRENTQAYESKMNYTVSGRPLDFSFMKIEDIASKYRLKCFNLNLVTPHSKYLIINFFVLLFLSELRKENERGGLRKPIIMSEDEEDAKKNENGDGPASEENAQEVTTAQEPREKIIRAPQTQQINQILLNNNISLQSK